MRVTKFVQFITVFTVILGLSILPACDKEPTDNQDTAQIDTN